MYVGGSLVKSTRLSNNNEEHDPRLWTFSSTFFLLVKLFNNQLPRINKFYLEHAFYQFYQHLPQRFEHL